MAAEAVTLRFLEIMEESFAVRTIVRFPRPT